MAYIEFIEGEKHAEKGADVMDTADHFKDAGYILKEDELVIDIDNLPKDLIERIIQVFDIDTQIVWSDRGAHLYFKRPARFTSAGHITPLGFEVETKHYKNTHAVTIKRNGVLRTIENEGKRAELPEVFNKVKTKSTPESLLGLSEGDGRNSKLFKHKQMISYIPTHIQIIRFINEYIFADKLEKEEFETIIRNTTVDKENDDEYIIAEKIRMAYNVVKFREELYFRHNGKFTNDDDLLNKMVYKEAGQVRSTFVDEIIKQLMKRATTINEEKPFDIQFNNGILRTGKFIEVEYEGFTPFRINIDYKPDAEPVEEVDNYINHLTNNDPQYRELLLEILGHTLIVDPELKRLLAKFFIFVGDGGNGKGTLLTIIRRILNQENCTGLSIADMSDERYLVTLKGKLANLGDDIQDEPINNKQMKILKNISTCDFIAVRELYKQASQIVLTTSLIFTSNHILKSFEKGESYKRRVVWLPMYSKPSTKDPLFITKLTTDEALEYWVRLIVEGYMRLYDNQRFTDSELVTNFNDDYHQENDTSIVYINELEQSDVLGIQPPKIYEQYEIWCEENGLNVMSRKSFNATISEMLGLSTGYKRLDGKTTARVFITKEEAQQKEREKAEKRKKAEQKS